MSKQPKPATTKATKTAAEKPAAETVAATAETKPAAPAADIHDVLGIAPVSVKEPTDNEEETPEALEARLAREAAANEKPAAPAEDDVDELAAFEAEMEGKKKKIRPETAFGETPRVYADMEKKKKAAAAPPAEKRCKGNHSMYPNTEEFFDKNEDGTLKDYSKDYLSQINTVVKGEPVKNPRRQQPQRVIRMPQMPGAAK